MTGSQAVAYAFVRREEKHAGNVFTDGTTAYSYSFAYPIARRIDGQTVVVNDEQYSVTTSKHRNAIIRELQQSGYRDIGEDGCKLDTFAARVYVRN